MSPYKSQGAATDAGKDLFASKSLSSNGKIACATCHNQYSKGKLDLTKSKPWPHHVAMGGGVITLDQMIQICMVKPMKSTAFSWDDNRLQALNAYVQSMRK